ncbi:hypothetical protein [Dyadobacter sp. LHD-138]|uniref:hypothetical protein n=1 Tax=Dyadobacter sp. LHD-138 TaxID=3071413 RepID=UPI0027E01D16|nr:hypothetical protein [Dyadobacter sp. LHD-138]MDQ6479827.1 hypothetical protein [Dyadobacter sp. LHD-138]
MDISQESAIENFEKVTRIDANRYPINKYSRWLDTKGRLLIITGFYHRWDPGSHCFDRIALDVLIVPEEKVEYMEIRDFIQFIRLQKLMPWKEEQAVI